MLTVCCGNLTQSLETVQGIAGFYVVPGFFVNRSSYVARCR